jgi:hypothetical protein
VPCLRERGNSRCVKLSEHDRICVRCGQGIQVQANSPRAPVGMYRVATPIMPNGHMPVRSCPRRAAPRFSVLAREPRDRESRETVKAAQECVSRIDRESSRGKFAALPFNLSLCHGSQAPRTRSFSVDSAHAFLCPGLPDVDWGTNNSGDRLTLDHMSSLAEVCGRRGEAVTFWKALLIATTLCT